MALTHFDGKGDAHMVDVSDKAVTSRIAVAENYIKMRPETFDIIAEGKSKKGDVLGVARLAGIMAAKRTADLIPLCHPLPITKVSIELTGLRHGQGSGQGDGDRRSARGLEGRRQIRALCCSMISVNDALAQLFDLVSPNHVETVPLRKAASRVLARDVVAARSQPPFAVSSMDGYALRQAEVEPDAMFKVIGEAAAGHRFEGTVKAGQAVRIFTGAPVPDGADFVVIQEDTTRRGDLLMLGHDIDGKTNIRPAGGDFTQGDVMPAPRRLRPSDIALLASMNIADVPVHAAPRVAIIATGDELVQPRVRIR